MNPTTSNDFRSALQILILFCIRLAIPHDLHLEIPPYINMYSSTWHVLSACSNPKIKVPIRQTKVGTVSHRTGVDISSCSSVGFGEQLALRVLPPPSTKLCNLAHLVKDEVLPRHHYGIPTQVVLSLHGLSRAHCRRAPHESPSHSSSRY